MLHAVAVGGFAAAACPIHKVKMDNKQVVYKPPVTYNKEYKPVYDTTIENPRRTFKVYILDCTDGTSDSETVTDDFILTGLFVTGGADAASSTYASIFIDSIQILSINNGVSAATVNNLTYIPIPNWLIKKGNILRITLSAVGGAVAVIAVNFIGYYASG